MNSVWHPIVVYTYILRKMFFMNIVGSLHPYQAAFGDWMTLRSTGLRDLPDGSGVAMGSESWSSYPSLGLLGAQAQSRGRDREDMTPKCMFIPSLFPPTYAYAHER